jgi:hypothetical protein
MFPMSYKLRTEITAREFREKLSPLIDSETDDTIQFWTYYGAMNLEDLIIKHNNWVDQIMGRFRQKITIQEIDETTIITFEFPAKLFLIWCILTLIVVVAFLIQCYTGGLKDIAPAFAIPFGVLAYDYFVWIILTAVMKRQWIKFFKNSGIPLR